MCTSCECVEGCDSGYGNVIWKQPHLLDLSYAELKTRNLEIKKERVSGVTNEVMRERFLNYLEDEDGIKSVMVCFSDLEGRLQSLEYDKDFILGAEDNLTFDGSSINGFTSLAQSDLRLRVDWRTFRWLPSDLFGAGKVLVFANVCNEDGSYYHSDFRSQLSSLSDELLEKDGVTVNVAPEIEGFLFKGVKAEQAFDELEGFELATMSGYFSSLPQDTLRMFIDKFAEVKRALAFENEKDHPEVAPAQFELNYKYTLVLDAADQVQLYKLLARQVAKSMGFTASFLPKPVQNLNGSGMHVNLSLSVDGKNVFYDRADKNRLSKKAYSFIDGVLSNAKGLCLLMNSSVNSYRRLDPNFEAPNAIKFSSIDRGSMIRIPMGNEKSARIEIRTVAPDCNPYLCLFGILKAGLSAGEMDYKKEVEILPGTIYEALEYYRASDFVRDLLGEENHEKYADIKEEVAERSPKALGSRVKNGEVLYHHEVRNQLLWSDF